MLTSQKIHAEITKCLFPGPQRSDCKIMYMTTFDGNLKSRYWPYEALGVCAIVIQVINRFDQNLKIWCFCLFRQWQQSKSVQNSGNVGLHVAKNCKQEKSAELAQLASRMGSAVRFFSRPKFHARRWRRGFELFLNFTRRFWATRLVQKCAPRRNMQFCVLHESFGLTFDTFLWLLSIPVRVCQRSMQGDPAERNKN